VSAMVLAKEALKGGTASQVDRYEGRPLGEKVAEDGRVLAENHDKTCGE
jgi:hypothetical protein